MHALQPRELNQLIALFRPRDGLCACQIDASASSSYFASVVRCPSRSFSLASPPNPAPKIRGSPTPFRLQNNDAPMSCQPSTTSPNAPPVPLPNGQHTPSTFLSHLADGQSTTLGPRACSCALDTTHPFPLQTRSSNFPCLYRQAGPLPA